MAIISAGKTESPPQRLTSRRGSYIRSKAPAPTSRLWTPLVACSTGLPTDPSPPLLSPLCTVRRRQPRLRIPRIASYSNRIFFLNSASCTRPAGLPPWCRRGSSGDPRRASAQPCCSPARTALTARSRRRSPAYDPGSTSQSTTPGGCNTTAAPPSESPGPPKTLKFTMPR